MAYGFKSGGRKKGTMNKATLERATESRDMALALLKKIRLRELLEKAFLDLNGNHKRLSDTNIKLLMRMLDYAWGKPLEHVEVTLNVRQVVEAARERVMMLEGEDDDDTIREPGPRPS